MKKGWYYSNQQCCRTFESLRFRRVGSKSNFSNLRLEPTRRDSKVRISNPNMGSKFEIRFGFNSRFGSNVRDSVRIQFEIRFECSRFDSTGCQASLPSVMVRIFPGLLFLIRFEMQGKTVVPHQESVPFLSCPNPRPPAPPTFTMARKGWR